MRLPDHTETAFAEALWTLERPAPSGIAPPARFKVYRNNVYAGLLACLKVRFPVVKRLVGDEFFVQCARVFIEKHPPRSPVLQHYGGDFPDFIANYVPAQALPYLTSVAELEWRRHVALHGADADPLDRAALAMLPAAQMEDLIFDLHPTCYILRSPFPVLTIWHTNTFDALTQTIPSDSPGETVLIVRPQEVVQLLLLGNGADVFIAQLRRGATLARAAEAARTVATSFELVAVLATLFRAGALIGFHLGEARVQK